MLADCFHVKVCMLLQRIQSVFRPEYNQLVANDVAFAIRDNPQEQIVTSAVELPFNVPEESPGARMKASFRFPIHFQ
jgi:hypothetical protein